MTCELNQIRKELNDLQKRMDNYDKKHVEQKEYFGKTCSKCGISLENATSYACPNADCPTGMGGKSC